MSHTNPLFNELGAKQRSIHLSPANYGIKMWLRKRCIYWPCFCAIAAPDKEIQRARIAHDSSSGSICASCCYQPSKCNYFIDISMVYRVGMRQSDYANLLTELGNWAPSIVQVLAESRSKSVCALWESLTHIEGYCEESMPSSYRYQLENTPSNSISDPWKSLGKRKQTYSASGPSKVLKLSHSCSPAATHVIRHGSKGKSREIGSANECVSDRKWLLLKQLADGKGIASGDAEGFLQKCTSCSMHFLSDTFDLHVLGCSNY
ncbi:hypothetical protein BDQ17DRAFT_1330299 [Cyathus striatus]|nr:hypothetical protein BDQ17DRAFT_1330299 [Cyathus striatus]